MNIENKDYKLSFINEGAQLSSFIAKSDHHEFIHDGIHGWGQQNPTLFPIVGKLTDGEYTDHGKTYKMGQHGVVRRAHFECVNQTENSICFEFKSNEDTLAVYPYAFRFEKEYVLDENRLTIHHRIYNTGESDMPFSIGHHPAFKCNFENHPLVEFEKEEDMHICKCSKEGYFTHDMMEYHPTPLKSIPMPFDQTISGTLVFKNLKSSKVTLREGEHGVSVSAVGFPYFAIWFNGDQFICLEPWLSHSNYVDTPKELSEKEEMNVLKKGESFLNSYTIEVY